MSYVSERVAAIIDEHGDSMTLARTGEATTITAKGKRIPGGFEEIGGTAAQQDFKVKLSLTALTASAWTVKVPKRHDTLTIDSRARAVLDAIPVGDSAVTALYIVTVKG